MDIKEKKIADVLLVEDNPGDILLLKEVLGENDNHINLKIINDGAEAMSYLKSNGLSEAQKLPDLIILDLNLPKKNGREILANIRSDENLKNLSVIIFTSSDAEEDVTICRNLDVINYYKKPIDFDEYIETIKTIEKLIGSIAGSRDHQ